MRKRRRLGCVSRLVLLGFLVVIVVPLIGLIGASIQCQIFTDVPPLVKDDPERQQIIADISDYARGEDQTYLTLPEWYIVFNADEYAAFIAEKPPSQFPYFRAIEQFWRSYYQVCNITGGYYPFNAEYQLTLAVISVSFTVETMLRGAYENTVGRIAEWTSTSELTPEDAYARRVAKEYGDFIHTIPWYEFPFREKLQGLWRETSLWGPNSIRKWERKIALSAEYGLKALYGALLNQGADAAFAPINLETFIWAEGVSEAVLQQEPEARLVKPIAAQVAIIAVPRYEAFTQIVPRLAEQGVTFVEIAGNDEILVTAIAPQTWTYNLSEADLIFDMPVLAQPDHTRLVLKVPVKSLHQVLMTLRAQGVMIEHIYDY